MTRFAERAPRKRDSREIRILDARSTRPVAREAEAEPRVERGARTPLLSREPKAPAMRDGVERLRRRHGERRAESREGVRQEDRGFLGRSLQTRSAPLW